MRDTIRTVAEALHDRRLERAVLVDGSSVLLDTETLAALVASPTASCLLGALEAGAEDIPALVRALEWSYRVEPDTAEQDARAFVREVEDLLCGGPRGKPPKNA